MIIISVENSCAAEYFFVKTVLIFSPGLFDE